MDKIRHNKKILIEALISTLGVITSACKKAGIARQTFYNYYNNDVKFKKEVDDIENIALDFVESKLYSQISDDNITATIFYLKTKGKKRGYIERQEITGKDGKDLPQFTGFNFLPSSEDETKENA